MKLIAQDNIKKKIWEVGIEPIDNYGSISASIGLMKGDLIIYAGDGDPRRFSPGSVAGKVIMTDPTADLGWVLSDPGGIPTTQLRNVSGGQIAAGRVVMLTYSSNIPSFVLATVDGTAPLFITAESSGNSDVIGCYGTPGMVVPVLCEGTIARGNGIKVTSTGIGGKAGSVPGAIGIALEARSGTGSSLIKVLLTGTGGKEQENTGDMIKTWSGQALTVTDGYEHRSRNSHNNALVITLPNDPAPLFRCTVSFYASGSFAGITFKKGTAAYTVKHVGHALNKKSVQYNLAIWWDGLYYWCSAKAA